MSPAGGERIERKASPEIHHGHDRPAIGLQDLALPRPKMPSDQADSRDKGDTYNKEVSRSQGHDFLNRRLHLLPNHRSVACAGKAGDAWQRRTSRSNAMPTQIGENRAKKMLIANELVLCMGGQPVAHSEHRDDCGGVRLRRGLH
jgi:hypothetical protein